MENRNFSWVNQLCLWPVSIAMALQYPSTWENRAPSLGRRRRCFFLSPCAYGGFHSHGGTLKWLIYKGKSHLEMDDVWGYPLFQENTIYLTSFKLFQSSQIVFCPFSVLLYPVWPTLCYLMLSYSIIPTRQSCTSVASVLRHTHGQSLLQCMIYNA